MTKKAYSYTRMSSGKQLRGNSLTRQLEKARIAADEYGWELDDTMRDIGVSGYTGKNIEDGALGHFIEMCQDGDINKGSVLIVENLDRFSRQRAIDAFGIFSEILKTGVDIFICDDRRLFTQDNMDMGNLFISIGGMVRAHEESSRKANLIATAWATKRKTAKNKILTKTCPAWLTVNEDKTGFIVNRERVKTLEYIFKLSIEGYGYQGISKKFNNENMPTFTDRGNGWHPAYIKDILRKKAVIGHYQPHKRDGLKRKPVGDVVENYYPKVIDEKTFYSAQKAIDERIKTGRGRKGRRFSNIFSGLCRCGECGSPLVYEDRAKGTRSKAKRTLRCYGTLRGICDSGKHHKYDIIEQLILKNLKELNISRLNAPKKNKRKEINEDLESERGQLITVIKRRERLALEFGDGDDDTMLGVIKRLGDEEKKHRIKIEDLNERMKRITVPETKTSEAVDNIEAYGKLLEGADDNAIFHVRTLIATELKKIIKWVRVYRDSMIILFAAQTDHHYAISPEYENLKDKPEELDRLVKLMSERLDRSYSEAEGDTYAHL
jgi:hypothetical protein